MNFHSNWMKITANQYPRIKSDLKIYFLKNDGIGKKTVTFWILAYLVANCCCQGNNRISVIKQSTLGGDLIQKCIF
jgi:hypothetical protein